LDVEPFGGVGGVGVGSMGLDVDVVDIVFLVVYGKMRLSVASAFAEGNNGLEVDDVEEEGVGVLSVRSGVSADEIGVCEEGNEDVDGGRGLEEETVVEGESVSSLLSSSDTVEGVTSPKDVWGFRDGDEPRDGPLD
jgi:hypothetical protein